MRRQARSQKSKAGSYRLNIMLFIILLITLHLSLVTETVADATKWSGVDESVVEKFAEEHGRPPKDPLINTDQGDLLLFMFLMGGLIGGFAAGYYWRMLVENRTERSENREQTKHLKQGSNNVRL